MSSRSLPPWLPLRPATPGDPGPDCLSPELLAELAEGSLDPERRSAAVRHLAECSHCLHAASSIARLLEDPGVAAADPIRRRRPAWIAAAATAAAIAVTVAVAVGREVSRDRDSGSHRASVVTESDQPAPVSPLGTSGRPEALRWHPVPSADRYRVTLYDPEGGVLYETELSDTSASLPDTVRLAAGRLYLWKVDARTDWDRWTSSPLFRFSLGEAPRP